MLVEFIHHHKDHFYFFILGKTIGKSSSVLDVGCGASSPLGNIRKTFQSVGIDLFQKSITESKQKKVHDKYINGNILELQKYCKKKSFDTVIALDVIEHFKKKDGLQLIKKMENVAKKRVIILTPNGFYPQDEINGNPYQRHLSGWSVTDFRKLGYHVYGLRGLKYLRGNYASITVKPWFFWGIIAYISEPLLLFIPNFSYHIFAVKDMYET